MDSTFIGWALALISMTGIAVSVVTWSLKNGISPMPSSSKAKLSLLSLLPVNLGGNVYELGSGWGTLLIPLAKKYPHCQMTGFETSPLPFWSSRLWLSMTNLSNVKLARKDFFFVDLSDASLIVCYLYPGAMKKLNAKFDAELKPGTLVISNTFAVPEWKAESILEIHDLYRTKIYLYRISEKAFLEKTPQQDT